MKVAVYTPYLDWVGGGEKYILTIAEYLSQYSHPEFISVSHFGILNQVQNDDRVKDDKDVQDGITVDFLLGTHLYNVNIQEIKDKVQKLHNLDLSKVNFIKAPIGIGSSGIKRLAFLKKYDYLFYLSDGSIFYSTAKNSIIHLQSPIPNPSNLTAKGRVKLSSWKLIIYNSKFTQENAQKFWPKKSAVIYPPVNIENFKVLTKKQQIISVGRFAAHTRSKKHEILINAFKDLSKEKAMKGWSLHLVGGILEGHESYLEELKKLAAGLPIYFHTNLNFQDLIKMYGESGIYWHSAGYGETDPQKMEHFGITTVEAMASGCIPVVINLGGQPEIVTPGEDGFLWDSPAELVKYTLDLVGDESLQKKLGQKALEKSKMFSKERFCQEIEKLVM